MTLDRDSIRFLVWVSTGHHLKVVNVMAIRISLNVNDLCRQCHDEEVAGNKVTPFVIIPCPQEITVGNAR